MSLIQRYSIARCLNTSLTLYLSHTNEPDLSHERTQNPWRRFYRNISLSDRLTAKYQRPIRMKTNRDLKREISNPPEKTDAEYQLAGFRRPMPNNPIFVRPVTPETPLPRGMSWHTCNSWHFLVNCPGEIQEELFAHKVTGLARESVNDAIASWCCDNVRALDAPGNDPERVCYSKPMANNQLQSIIISAM